MDPIARTRSGGFRKPRMHLAATIVSCEGSPQLACPPHGSVARCLHSRSTGEVSAKALVRARPHHRREQFDRMQNLAVQARMKLFGAGSPAGQERSSTPVFFRLAHLLEKVLADRHAEFVEVLFVAKASRHAAALHRRSGHIETNAAQKRFCWRSAVDGFLL